MRHFTRNKEKYIKMAEEKMIGKFLENIPLNEFYNDLFKPGMKKAGEALSTVIDGANLILLPLKLINSKSRVYFDNNLKKYSDKINANEELTLTQVPQYVGLPILDKLTYLDENELAETFINLLTKASFEETLKLVHPAYLSILERLSADEAKILFHFKSQAFIPYIDIYGHKYVEKIKKPEFLGQSGSKTKEQLTEIINYSTQDKQSIYLKLAWNLTGIENKVDLMFPENIDIYLENLELNGLIQFERKMHNINYTDEYENLINVVYKENYNKLEKDISKMDISEFKIELQIRKGFIEFTELGKGFLKACIKEIE